MNNKKNHLVDIETEKALLGLCIVNSDALHKSIAYINEEDFFDEKNKFLFSILKNEFSNTKEIDLVLLNSNIEKHKDGKNILGSDYTNYISSVIFSAGYYESLNEYLKVLGNKSNLRKIYKILNKSIEDFDKVKDYEGISALIQNEILNIENNRNSNKNFETIATVIDSLIEKIKNRVDNPESSGLISGFRDLDEITLGFQKGDLIIVAARPSMGKTAFALNIAANVAKTNNVAFFSLEMPSEQLGTRILSIFSGINGSHLKNPSSLNDRDWVKLSYSKKIISKIKLFIDDSPSLKLEQLIWKAKRMKKESNLDLIIIDYLQLITTGDNRNENRQQEVSKISRSLKQLARELDIPIIALAQLSRRTEQREDKVPLLSDLRESGAIEQDADVISFIYRDDYYKKEKKDNFQTTNIIIAKHRNGPTGNISLIFDTNLGQFSDSDIEI